MDEYTAIQWAIFIAVIVALYKIFIHVVNQGEAVVIERMGKFNRILKAGVHFINPLLESRRSVKWSSIQVKDGNTQYFTFESTSLPIHKEIVFDPRPVSCLTKSGATIDVDVAIRCIIEDPYKCVYEVDNLYRSLQVLVEAALFKAVQDCDIETMISSRGKLGGELNGELNYHTLNWGVRVVAVDIQNVDIPDSLTHSLLSYLTKEQENKVILAAEEGRRKLEISKLLSQAAIDKQTHENNMERIMNERRESIMKAETEAMIKRIEFKSKDENLKLLFGDNVADKNNYIIDEMRASSLLSRGPESLRTVVIPHDLKLMNDRIFSS